MDGMGQHVIGNRFDRVETDEDSNHDGAGSFCSWYQ
jgi:hypothetical protein